MKRFFAPIIALLGAGILVLPAVGLETSLTTPPLNTTFTHLSTAPSDAQLLAAVKKKNADANPANTAVSLYILHGGMSDPTNESPANIRNYLVSQGVSSNNIIVITNPYPAIPPTFGNLPNLQGKDKGKKIGDFLKDLAIETKENALKNWGIYKQSAEMESEISQTTYSTLISQLQEKKSLYPNQPLSLVWIGLSAGGQMGLTMSERLARDQSEFQFNTIVTLGSPILRNQAPAPVRIISCISDQDQILTQLARPGYAKAVIGVDVQRVPPNMDSNDEVRRIEMKITRKIDVTEGHNLWHRDPKILDKALKGVVPN